MTNNIYSSLARKDPQNKKYYTEKTKNFTQEINKIQQAYDKVLSNCENKTLVHLGHFSFGYIAKKYNLKYITLQGHSELAEPSAKAMLELIQIINSRKIKYIFTDAFLNLRLAKTIAKQTNAVMLTLNPMGNISKQEDYISISAQNLDNLAMGLQCQK
jgi:zinc transport system substrate-binding protein